MDDNNNSVASLRDDDKLDRDSSDDDDDEVGSEGRGMPEKRERTAAEIRKVSPFFIVCFTSKPRRLICVGLGQTRERMLIGQCGRGGQFTIYVPHSDRRKIIITQLHMRNIVTVLNEYFNVFFSHMNIIILLSIFINPVFSIGDAKMQLEQVPTALLVTQPFNKTIPRNSKAI